MRKIKGMGIALMIMGMVVIGMPSVHGLAAIPQLMSEVEVFSTDKIVTRYRIHDGKMQYRRWNDTKQCWVDSSWIDL